MVMPALLLTAALQPAVPPPPPLPRSGRIQCALRDQAGETVNLNGVLGLSEPRAEGRRFPQATFTSDTVPALAGTYAVQWTSHRGDFSSYSREHGVAMSLVSWTFGEQTGAMAVQVNAMMGGPSRYFAGFCRSSFSSQAGSDPK